MEHANSATEIMAHAMESIYDYWRLLARGNREMRPAAEYMQQSAKCLSLSQETNDSDGNLLYLLMAQAWIALARQVERKDLQQKERPYRSLEAELSEMLRKRVA